MAQEATQKTGARRLAPAGALFAAAGLVLFGYVVWRAGVEKIWGELSGLGYGFLVIIALSGLRFRHALGAYLTGDAVGNVLPLGIVVSEPTKVYCVRDRVPLVAATSAIAVENIFYSLSVSLFLFGGAAAMLLSFPLTRALRWTSVGILVGVVVIFAIGFVVVRAEWRILSGLAERLYRRGIGRRALESKRGTLRGLEDRVYGFYRRNGRWFLPILALEMSFHLLGVAEAYVTLLFISPEPPTVLMAFVLESVNRVINVVFKFVPLRVGIDEAGAGFMTSVLKLGASVGVTLAIARKARMLVWTAVGIALLVGRGLSVRRVVREAEQTMAEGRRMRAEG